MSHDPQTTERNLGILESPKNVVSYALKVTKNAFKILSICTQAKKYLWSWYFIFIDGWPLVSQIHIVEG